MLLEETEGVAPAAVAAVLWAAGLLIALAAGAERASAHPLAKAVVRAAAALPAYGPEEAQTIRSCIRRRPFTGR